MSQPSPGTTTTLRPAVALPAADATPSSNAIRMTGAAPAGGNDLFGPRCRRGALVAAYPELEAICTALGFVAGPSLGECSPALGWTQVILARSAHPPPPAPERDWSMATIPELISDLIATHHVPLRHELQRLGILIDHLASMHRHALLAALRKVYRDFAQALVLHLDQEEGDLFPLCIALEEALAGRRGWDDQDVTSLIRFTGHGHGECESGVRRIATLLEAAAAGISDPDLAVVCAGFTALRRDLAMHTAKEGEILMPAAIFSEERLSARRIPGHDCSTGMPRRSPAGAGGSPPPPSPSA
jgi:iron-sulfur cluster repair protein YtfE (RIC family)